MNYKIATLPGDGIGPEIVNEAQKVLNAIGEKCGHSFEYTEALMGACAIRETGNPLPDETIEVCKNSDAILFGAIGDPEFDNNPAAKVRPEQGLLKLRKSLGLFANVRPVKQYDELVSMSPLKPEIIQGTDIVIIRELTGGIYFGEPRGRTEDGNTAFDSCVYSREEIVRVAKIAFDTAMKRDKRLCMVDKSNVLATSRLWKEVVQGMEADYPEVQVSYMYVDNAAMQLVQNPSGFDVMLTENMFGDILTDESSVITGSIGVLPSASMGAEVALYEPIHGSYPQAAGKNIANPIATILSAAMMLDQSFGLNEEAEMIRQAVTKCIRDGKVTEDLNKENPCGTSDVGDYVAELIMKNEPAMA